MNQTNQRKITIEAAILMAFLFGIIVAYVAYQTGSFLMGLIFLADLQIIILLAILFMLENITEVLEKKL